MCMSGDCCNQTYWKQWHCPQFTRMVSWLCMRTVNCVSAFNDFDHNKHWTSEHVWLLACIVNGTLINCLKPSLQDGKAAKTVLAILLQCFIVLWGWINKICSPLAAAWGVTWCSVGGRHYQLVSVCMYKIVNSTEIFVRLWSDMDSVLSLNVNIMIVSVTDYIPAAVVPLLWHGWCRRCQVVIVLCFALRAVILSCIYRRK